MHLTFRGGGTKNPLKVHFIFLTHISFDSFYFSYTQKNNENRTCPYEPILIFIMRYRGPQSYTIWYLVFALQQLQRGRYGLY